MRKQGLHRRGGAALLALLLAMACFTVSVLAREDIDLDRSSSISVYFGSGSRSFSGVDFSLYRVADVSESGEYALTGDFRRYNVSLDGLDSSGWRALAQTLDAYAARDGLDPLKERETGSGGRAYFTGLRPGLYLVSGERYTSGRTVYTPEAMLVSVPGEADGGGWDYSVEVTCKYDRDEITEEYTSVSVKKVWDDGGDKSARPGYIYVQLLENGRVADTVVLSEANDWEYTWDDLDADSQWRVVERDVPDGYTVTVEREGRVFIITNTKPDDTPEPSESPEPSTSPDEPEKLPQTGQLWWPVPLLFCAGLIFVAAGLIIRRRRGNSDDR